MSNCVFVFSWQVSLLLIRHGADVDVEDKEGYTVLGRASNDFRPILVDAAKAMLEGWNLGVVRFEIKALKGSLIKNYVVRGVESHVLNSRKRCLSPDQKKNKE